MGTLGDGPVKEVAAMTLVLVADDDADLRYLVAFKLEQLGLEVVTAVDGTDALKLVRERRPQVAVLDVAMPGLTGIEVTRSIRSDPELAGTRVLMLTAGVQEHDVEKGFTAGADDYVTKPFSLRELVSRVQAMLARVTG
jgi:DNA-binding response OmpR family regulator